MKKTFVIVLIMFGIMVSALIPNSAFSDNSLPSENCLIINSENLNLEVPCANFLGNCFSFTLNFNSELAGWQLDPDTFTICELDLSGEENQECVLINEENLDLEVSCADYLGGCYSVILNFDQSLGIGWRLEADSFAPCEQDEPVELIVSANATPESGAAPLTTSFVCTVESGNPPYTYLWDFGDGSAESTEQNPTHTYDMAGTYTATVTVYDDEGQNVSESISIDVEETSTSDTSCMEIELGISDLNFTFDSQIEVNSIYYIANVAQYSGDCNMHLMINGESWVLLENMPSVAYGQTYGPISVPTTTINSGDILTTDIVTFSGTASTAGCQTTWILGSDKDMLKLCLE